MSEESSTPGPSSAADTELLDRLVQQQLNLCGDADAMHERYEKVMREDYARKIRPSEEGRLRILVLKSELQKILDELGKFKSGSNESELRKAYPALSKRLLDITIELNELTRKTTFESNEPKPSPSEKS